MGQQLYDVLINHLGFSVGVTSNKLSDLTFQEVAYLALKEIFIRLTVLYFSYKF